MNILLIEDNAPLAASIGEYLEGQGDCMDFAYDGRAGLQLAAEGDYDVLIVDIGLPGMDGLSLCTQLRKEHQSPVPILILTARDTLEDKVKGFEAGGDDFLVKPFAMKELAVRIEALVRRSERQAHQRILKCLGIEYNLDTQQVFRDGVPIVLPKIPRKILETLLRNQDRVVTRAMLESILWGDDLPSADVLRVHVHSLRAAIDGPFETSLLHTVRGVGYRLCREEEA